MKFADFVSRDAIKADLSADDKEGVIREMVQALLAAHKVPAEEFESIVKAILKREELGSTGIGRGVAVPHTKHPSVDSLICTVAISHQGLNHLANHPFFVVCGQVRFDCFTAHEVGELHAPNSFLLRREHCGSNNRKCNARYGSVLCQDAVNLI